MTILQQLGGNKFIAMTGAKTLVKGKNSLTFAILSTAKTKNKANKVHIVLEPDDTYTMTFYRLIKLDLKEISKHSGLNVDQLRKTFTSQTGLDTSL